MNVPDGWRVEQLANVTSFVTSGSRGWAKYYSTDGALFLRMGNLQRNSIELDLADVQRVLLPTDVGESVRTRVQAGDLLMSITAYLGSVGVIPANMDEAYVNQHIALIRPIAESIDPLFFGYLMMSAKCQRDLIRRGDQGAKVGLNLDTIRKLPLGLPPIGEQRRIAEILGAWDEAIAQVADLIKAKQKLKRALMQKLLTGKLRFPEFAGQAWDRVSLGSLYRKEKGRAVEVHSAPLNYRYIGSKALDGDHEGWTADDGLLVQPGDVLLLWDGEYAGKAAYGLHGVAGSTIAVLRATGVGADARFVGSVLRLRNAQVRAITEGSGIPHCPRDFLAWFKLDIPSLSEQQAVADLFDVLDDEVAILAQKQVMLLGQKRGLMQQLLTGKTRVSVDPEDA